MGGMKTAEVALAATALTTGERGRDVDAEERAKTDLDASDFEDKVGDGVPDEEGLLVVNAPGADMLGSLLMVVKPMWFRRAC